MTASSDKKKSAYAVSLLPADNWLNRDPKRIVVLFGLLIGFTPVELAPRFWGLLAQGDALFSGLYGALGGYGLLLLKSCALALLGLLWWFGARRRGLEPRDTALWLGVALMAARAQFVYDARVFSWLGLAALGALDLKRRDPLFLSALALGFACWSLLDAGWVFGAAALALAGAWPALGAALAGSLLRAVNGPLANPRTALDWSFAGPGPALLTLTVLAAFALCVWRLRRARARGLSEGEAFWILAFGALGLRFDAGAGLFLAAAAPLLGGPLARVLPTLARKPTRFLKVCVGGVLVTVAGLYVIGPSADALTRPLEMKDFPVAAAERLDDADAPGELSAAPRVVEYLRWRLPGARVSALGAGDAPAALVDWLGERADWNARYPAPAWALTYWDARFALYRRGGGEDLRLAFPPAFEARTLPGLRDGSVRGRDVRRALAASEERGAPRRFVERMRGLVERVEGRR